MVEVEELVDEVDEVDDAEVPEVVEAEVGGEGVITETEFEP